MTTSYPTTIPPTPSPVAKRRRLPAVPAVAGSWRYDSNRRPRAVLVTALVISAALHGGMLWGYRPSKPKPPAVKVEDTPAVMIIPQLKDLEPPEPAPSDEPVPVDTAAMVPTQADLPTIARPNDFVQQIDFNSLIERPDMSQAKVFAIPENIQRGVNLAQKIGTIFNLADLDRHPEAIAQPAPIVPASLKREGRSATVQVEFIVDSEGKVVAPYVTDSNDHAFDDAAVAGVSRWRFKAGMRGGRRVNTRMRVPIVFTIKEGLD